MATTIALAKKEELFVCVGGEDASRAKYSFLKEVIDIAKELGANRFRYCDTVGILTPHQTYTKVKKLSKLGLELEMHTHNDLGMATANAIAGLEAGAKSVNTTVIGLGERAGNASFEQVLMSLIHQFGEKDRVFNHEVVKSFQKTGLKPQIRNFHLALQLLVQDYLHMNLVYDVDGMLKNSSAYEPFSPSEVGSKRFYPIGKHSGSKTLK